MKIIVKNNKELAKAMKLLLPLALTKTNKRVPVLQHILVDATEGVKLTATDLETAIRVDASEMFEVVGAGASCIPPSFLKELENGSLIEIDTENPNFARVGKNKVAIMNAEDFPIFPDLNGQEMGKVNIGNTIKRVIHASGDGESRFNTNCICLNFTKQEMQATDGHRAAIVKDCLPYSPAIEDEDNQILIWKTAAKILSGIREPVNITKRDNDCIFSWGNITMLTRLVEGDFPKIYKAIPERFDFAIEVETLSLINIIKKAMKLVDKGKWVVCEISGDTMEVSATNSDKGEFMDNIRVSNPANAQCLFGISPIYLMDVLKETGKTAEIEFVAEKLMPIKFTGNNSDFLSIIMPCRTDKEFFRLPDPEVSKAEIIAEPEARQTVATPSRCRRADRVLAQILAT